MDWIEITMFVCLAAVPLVVEALGMWGARQGYAWGGTISAVMHKDGRIWLVYPWTWGVMGGHWFWPWAAPDGWWVALIVASALLVIYDLVNHKDAPKWAPFAAFIGGAVSGAAFWAMGY